MKAALYAMGVSALSLRLLCTVYVRFILSHKARRAAMISISSALSQTPVYTAKLDTGLVHRAVCMFTSQLSLILTVPTYEGMARLS